MQTNELTSEEILLGKLEYLKKEYQRSVDENMELYAENRALKAKQAKKPRGITVVEVDSSILQRDKDALEKARSALAFAIYQSECGQNAGLRKIYSNQADWLSSIVYLANKQYEKELHENS